MSQTLGTAVATWPEKKQWSKEEDAMLMELVRDANSNNLNFKKGAWTIIAASIAGRTNQQCRKHWVNYLSKGREDFGRKRKMKPTSSVGKTSPVESPANETEIVMPELDRERKRNC
mmetsp:Transcript_20539/g.28592  ORF Transcript_20539/g.28592 Transcript_20539/m.28592 type:complete len:116 (-) Transcript_20539:106-453(-)